MSDKKHWTVQFRDVSVAVSALVFAGGLIYLLTQPKDTFEKVTSIATAVATGVAAVGLAFTGYQMLLARRVREDGRAIARGNFILQFDARLDRFDTIYRQKLDEWVAKNSGPANDAEWAEVSQYLGLFERLEVLIDQSSIDMPVVRSLYFWRIKELVDNAHIRQRYLIDPKRQDGWYRFIKLCDRLDIDIPGLKAAQDADDAAARKRLAALAG